MKEIALQGFLYDAKSSFLKGSAKAPPAIRKILNNGAGNFFTENGLDLEKTVLHDMGDFEISDYFDLEEITRTNITKGIPLISLGGDHSIAYPIIKAVVEVYKEIDILQIDAHSDLYDEFEGDRYSHACPFARIMEDGLSKRLVQVGIRTLSSEQRQQAKRFNVDIREMRSLDVSDLSHFKRPLYISLDMDGFDPSCAPGVSHHEPGGLTSRQVIDLINSIETPIIGADIVEYNPDRDIHDMTGALAAKLLKEIWGRMIENNR